MYIFRPGFIALFISFLLIRPVIGYAVSENAQDLAVQVHDNDGVIIVDVAFFIPATVRESWNVLTDFDHMATFVSNLESSRVIAQSGNTIQVAQKGHAGHGPLSFDFDSIREIRLKPYEEIRSRMIKGNMKKLVGTTRLRAEGTGTQIMYYGESISNVWMPPGIGPAFIEDEIRKQYDELRQEILRRKRLGNK